MNVDAAASSASAAGGDLVHFLITIEAKTCRLTVPKKHLKSLPSSYISALSSERWAGEDPSRGAAGSPFALSADESPANIRKIWGDYRHASTALVPLIQRAYETIAADAACGTATPIVLPHNVEMEDGVHFLEYYGLCPGADRLQVPKDGPAALYLRCMFYAKEAKLVKAMRDTLVGHIANNLKRITYFVFSESSDDNDFIKRNNAVHGAEVVPFRLFNTKTGRHTFCNTAANSTLRDKLVAHLTEEDKLDAEFVGKEIQLADPKGRTIPTERQEEQTLVAVGEEDMDDEEAQHWPQEYIDDWYEEDHRIFGWRYVLKVQVPA